MAVKKAVINVHTKLLFFRKKGRDQRVMERTDIVASRATYLRDIRDARRAGSDIIYLDETWVNAGHAPKREWQLKDGTSRKRKGEGKGSRWILCDAGGKLKDGGFVPNATLLFQVQNNTDTEK